MEVDDNDGERVEAKLVVDIEEVEGDPTSDEVEEV